MLASLVEYDQTKRLITNDFYEFSLEFPQRIHRSSTCVFEYYPKLINQLCLLARPNLMWRLLLLKVYNKRMDKDHIMIYQRHKRSSQNF